MFLFDRVLDALAQRLQKRIQGTEQSQAFRDAGQKGSGYSVEAEVAEALADLMLLNFAMPITGEGDRARWLDKASDDFLRKGIRQAVAMAFLTGDAITVPSWNGHGFDNVVVDEGHFAILGANGDELTSVIYVVDEKRLKSGATYTLLRLVDLVRYTAADGTQANGTRYKTFIAKDGTITDIPLSRFPDWEEHNEPEWFVPNTDRLLVARFKSHVINPQRPNAMKGAPVCFGASDPIREIHYLTQAMHAEFELSEKAIFADRRLFKRTPIKGANGETVGYRVELPKGRERLFMDVAGQGGLDMKEWAPSIQLQPYLDNLEFQLRRVEKCVGVDAGIVSTPNDANYMNVDNVRKSTVHTQAFINTARKNAEAYLEQLLNAWDKLGNYYGVNPTSGYEVSYQWSDDYINTFADMQGALIAGASIGATDAVDYRMFLLGESPEQAAARVRDISGNQPGLTLEEVL